MRRCPELRVLGKVMHVSKSGRLIVKASHTPRLNSPVYDESFDLVGVVYDVMGPVSSPYVSIALEARDVDPRRLVGKMLYVKEVKRVGRKRRR